MRVVATGSYVPDAVVTNEHLHARFGFDSDWIVKRTGIRERRHALPHQATSDLCYEAARRCIEQAGVKPSDIDLLVLATFTPDMSFPFDGVPGAGPAQAQLPRGRDRRPRAPASCTPSSPAAPTWRPASATWP